MSKTRLFLFLSFLPMVSLSAECVYNESNQPDRTQCAIDEYRESLSALDDKFSLAQFCVGPKGHLLLTESQHVWSNLTMEYCKKENEESLGGSIYAQLFYGCMKRQADERIEILKAMTGNCVRD